MLQQRQARRGRPPTTITMKKSQHPENLLLKSHRMRFWPSDLAERKTGIWDWPAPPPGTHPRRKRPRRGPDGCLRVRLMYNRRPQLNPPADDLPF